MTQVQSCEASGSNLVERFNFISHTISENFHAPFKAQPVGMQHRPAVQSWACADGVVASRAFMSPMRLANRTTRLRPPSVYYVFVADQPCWFRPKNGADVLLPPSEFLISTSDMACEWLVQNDYSTDSFIIDRVLFDEYVPNSAALVGRRMKFPFGLDALMRATLESAWQASYAGRFDQVGPTLVRAFLEMLSTASVCQDRGRQAAKTSLDVRRAQVRAFIERNYARPDLSVSCIAEHLKLSRRYVQLALASDDETPTGYLRSCRLTASARLLSDAANAQRSITEIAFACGFNSSAHFSNEFKRAYGVTPREFRASTGATALDC